MRFHGPRRSLPVAAIVLLALISSDLRPVSGQVGEKLGVPDDWSHRHLLFSAPSELQETLRLRTDLRHIQQLARRQSGPLGAALSASEEARTSGIFEPSRSKHGKANQGLWGQSLSGTGSNWASPGPGVYPAKFGFNDINTVNCGNAAAPDFVAYGLKSGTVSSQTGTFTAAASAGTVTVGGSLVLTASTSSAATGTVTLANSPKFQDTVSIGGTTYIWQAASSTAATGTVTLTNPPASGDTATVGASTYIWRQDMAATGTVTLSSAPKYQDKVTVGATTYIWQSAASTAATGTVTLTNPPSYQDKVTVGATTYIWQSAASTVATGMVTLTNPPNAKDTVTVGSSTYIWQVAASTAATGTVTLANAPAANDTVTVGGSTYMWRTSCTGVGFCVLIGGSTTIDATNLKNAIGGACAGTACAANASVTATSATNVVSLTAKTTGASSNFTLSLPVNGGANSVSGGNNGAGCNGVAFCVATNAVTTTAATNLKNAIGGTCGGTACAANASVTANSATNVLTLTAKTAGSTSNFTLSLPVNTAGNSVSGGNNGTNSCAGVATCVALNASTTTSATNLANAIGGTCAGTACAANAGATATSAANVVTLTAKTAGSAGNFALSLPVNVAANAVSGGNNGTNSCAGVATCVALNASTTTSATNLANAIGGACAGTACAANAAVTATAAGNVVSLTAKTGGTGSNFALSLPVNGAGNSVAGGNNGTTGCTGVTFCVTTSSNTTTAATNLKNAIGGTCGGTACAANAAVTATSATNVVTLTARTTGAASNFALSLPVNGAGNTVAGGNNGTTSCTGVAFCVVLNASTTTSATNLKNAIGGTCGGTACAANAAVTATSATNVVTLTAKTAGTGGNFALSLPVNAAGNTVSGGGNGIDGANTGLNFATGVSANADAANLAAAIARNGSAVGVTATATTATVTVQSTVGGAIALAKTLTSFTWAGTTVPGTLTGGAATQATMVAYDNLYVSCTGTVPSVYWAYNTSTTTATSAQVVTSPVLSADGTQLAFVETSGTTAYVVILKWKAGQGTSATGPVTPSTQSTTGAAYATCRATTGSCQLTLSLGAGDSLSSPFVDYSNDILYVGDAAGKLHQMTGVFKGTPVLDTTNAGWPVNVDGGSVLTSPVYDSGSGLVFVGDAKGKLSSVGTGASPAVRNSGQIEFATSGITSPPLVDSTTGQVYVAVACDAACSASTNNAVFRLPAAFAGGATGTKQILAATGTAISTQSMFAGTFDNIYYSGSGTTGNMYVCGYSAGLAPTLFAIPLSGTWGSATVASTSLAGGPGGCSPVTENLSGVAATDWIFLSVTANGNLTGCTGDCIYSFNVFSGAPVLGAGRQATAGASGIIIDNSANATGASQIYYANLGVATSASGYSCPSPSGGAGAAATAGGCAVQASQAALR